LREIDRLVRVSSDDIDKLKPILGLKDRFTNIDSPRVMYNRKGI
jgi:hypothetical protein